MRVPRWKTMDMPGDYLCIEVLNLRSSGWLVDDQIACTILIS